MACSLSMWKFEAHELHTLQGLFTGVGFICQSGVHVPIVIVGQCLTSCSHHWWCYWESCCCAHELAKLLLTGSVESQIWCGYAQKDSLLQVHCSKDCMSALTVSSRNSQQRRLNGRKPPWLHCVDCSSVSQKNVNNDQKHYQLSTIATTAIMLHNWMQAKCITILTQQCWVVHARGIVTLKKSTSG